MSIRSFALRGSLLEIHSSVPTPGVFTLKKAVFAMVASSSTRSCTMATLSSKIGSTCPEVISSTWYSFPRPHVVAKKRRLPSSSATILRGELDAVRPPPRRAVGLISEKVGSTDMIIDPNGESATNSTLPLPLTKKSRGTLEPGPLLRSANKEVPSGVPLVRYNSWPVVGSVAENTRSGSDVCAVKSLENEGASPGFISFNSMVPPGVPSLSIGSHPVPPARSQNSKRP
ncbi:MAG: hypothetical protein JW384_04003 [Nitrosomonadaceae bacterium]|nr:hypothetical protein [Nitrosomonadaceae bacterium]